MDWPDAQDNGQRRWLFLARKKAGSLRPRAVA